MSVIVAWRRIDKPRPTPRYYISFQMSLDHRSTFDAAPYWMKLEAIPQGGSAIECKTMRDKLHADELRCDNNRHAELPLSIVKQTRRRITAVSPAGHVHG